MLFGKLFPGAPREFRSITPRQLFDAPELRAIAARAAEETLAKRRKLVAQLSEVTGAKADARCAKAVQTARAADAKVVAAQAALEAARNEAAQAQRECGSLSFGIQHERIGIIRELRDTADPRLEQFHDALADAWQDVRNAGAAIDMEMVDPGRTAEEVERDAKARFAELNNSEQYRARMSGIVPGVKPVRPPKYEQVTGSLQRIREVQEQVRAAQLEALDDATVTKRLDAWRAEVRPLLLRSGLRSAEMADEAGPKAA